jgi:hypothetical protein
MCEAHTVGRNRKKKIALSELGFKKKTASARQRVHALEGSNVNPEDDANYAMLQSTAR